MSHGYFLYTELCLHFLRFSFLWWTNNNYAQAATSSSVLCFDLFNINLSLIFSYTKVNRKDFHLESEQVAAVTKNLWALKIYSHVCFHKAQKRFFSKTFKDYSYTVVSNKIGGIKIEKI